MGDYQAQLARDRHEFSNIARIKLREACRRDASSFADVERVVDRLGEWVARLSGPKAELPVSPCRYLPARPRRSLSIAYRSDQVGANCLFGIYGPFRAEGTDRPQGQRGCIESLLKATVAPDR